MKTILKIIVKSLLETAYAIMGFIGLMWFITEIDKAIKARKK